MLCQICHVREAKVHSTSIVLGVEQTASICEECLNSVTPPDIKTLIQRFKNSTCEFCGAAGQCSTGDNFALMLGEPQRFHTFCFQCQDDYEKYMQEASALIAPDSSEDQLKKVVQRIRDGVDKYMKDAISKRPRK